MPQTQSASPGRFSRRVRAQMCAGYSKRAVNMAIAAGKGTDQAVPRGYAPVDMAHFAACPRLGLAINVHRCARFGGEARPVVHVVADQVEHLGGGRRHRGRAKRPTGDRPDVLLELRRFRRVHRPVAGIVYARRHFVDVERAIRSAQRIRQRTRRHSRGARRSRARFQRLRRAHLREGRGGKRAM